ncbi:MAG: riboflavin synthase [Proteobacteria bacterium]|nr:riboflavin synthase [Pseudomonadota bacterium]
MFTGLIEAVGTVNALEPRGDEAARLVLDAPFARELALGESVAVNGCCLTVTGKEGAISFDLLMETLNRTSLGDLKAGSRVNLERALRADGRFGGHFVQGHIDTTAEVLSAEPAGNDLNLVIAIPAGGGHYFIEKGSIAVNGVSLTVASLNAESFGLWIIPHTLQETNLGELKPGDRVNLEYDLIAKYAERQLGNRN